MIVELVSTGTELLLGQIVNTNAPYLAQRLNDMGYDVLYQSTVGDNRKRMAQVMMTALGRADIVITSGGLGPTQGDITKETTAELLGLEMHIHQPSVQHIRAFFEKRRLPMPENNLRQAMMPAGAIILENRRGTAPGVVLEKDGKIIIHLPGPPTELEHMFETSVVHYLNRQYGQQGTIVSRVLRTIGLGESSMEEKIREYILSQHNPTIALLARNGEIHIRLTAKATTLVQSNELLDALENKLRERIGEYIFGTDATSLEQTIGSLLLKNKMQIAVAESCTGGALSARITDVPGSSEYFMGGVISYSNESKASFLGVAPEIISLHGAVSPQTAVAMAKAVCSKFSADIGIGITGIAGPGGGSAEKPVGLVYIAISGPYGDEYTENRFTGQRTAIKSRAVIAALDMIRRYLNTKK